METAIICFLIGSLGTACAIGVGFGAYLSSKNLILAVKPKETGPKELPQVFN